MSEQQAANVELEDDSAVGIKFSDDDLQEDSAPSAEESERPGEQPEGDEESNEQGEDFVPDEELSEKERKRIDRITAEKYDAIRAKEALEAELEQLRREKQEREQQELNSRLEAPEPTPPDPDDYVLSRS